jgi:hypothetical protein
MRSKIFSLKLPDPAQVSGCHRIRTTALSNSFPDVKTTFGKSKLKIHNLRGQFEKSIKVVIYR